MQSALCPHLHHDDGVGRGHEVCRLVGPSVAQVGGPGHGSLQVQFPAVAADLAAVQVADPERAKRHIGLAEMPLQASLEPFRGRIILVVQGFADGFQSLRPVTGQSQFDEVRMLRPFVRFSGPQSNIVKGDTLLVRPSIDQCAQAAVAQRERLVEAVCRAIIVKRQRSGCAGCQRKQQEQEERKTGHNCGIYAKNKDLFVINVRNSCYFRFSN